MTTVLVVDDERDIVDALAELLGETYDIIVAYDGAEALGVLEAQTIHAVVLDLTMPVMNGEALMAELQKRELRVPVIFASAVKDLAERARRSGAGDFIAKPFDLEALEQKLARLLRSSSPGEGPNSTGGGSSSKPPLGGDPSMGIGVPQHALRRQSVRAPARRRPEALSALAL